MRTFRIDVDFFPKLLYKPINSKPNGECAKLGLQAFDLSLVAISPSSEE